MIRPGSPEYAEHLREEVEHYHDVFTEVPEHDPAWGTLLQPVPDTWREAEFRAAALVREQTGNDLDGHVLARLRRPGARMLSLGSGAGGVELSYARVAPGARITCLDVNEPLLETARRRAEDESLNIRFEAADLNTAALPEDAFDVVFCHASLHHLIELEHVFEQVRRTLVPGGELIVVDIVTLNGFRMHSETREAVHAIWRTLPPRLRINHTAAGKPRLDDSCHEADTSERTMECIRSEDIIPLLERYFRQRAFVPYFALCRRLFDTMYGPNYDLTLPLDRAIFEWVWQLDRYGIESGRLPPETFFGIYSL